VRPALGDVPALRPAGSFVGRRPQRSGAGDPGRTNVRVAHGSCTAGREETSRDPIIELAKHRRPVLR